MREAHVAGTNEIRLQCGSGTESPPGFHPFAGRLRAFALPGLAAFAGPLAGRQARKHARAHRKHLSDAGFGRLAESCTPAAPETPRRHRDRPGRVRASNGASGRRPGSSRGFRGRVRRAAAWTLAVGALALAAPAALAQDVTLVSNLEQTDTSGSSSQLAQAFDTGSNAAGYGLTSVTLRLAGAVQALRRGYLVRITPATSSGPDLSDSTKIITLATPATLTTDADNVFTAPAGTTLDAGATYMAVVTSADGTLGLEYAAGRTPSTGVDDDSADGWSIADTRFFRSTNTGTWSTSSTLLQFKITGTVSVGPTVVPETWSLKPSGLSDGDQFRLLFLSSTKRDGSSTDIATYNTFVQTRAAAGHTDIQAYSDGFTAVGCTEDVDARDNTGTTGTGVPIHWLNGNKVADDYADFYDEDWDEEAADKNELGNNGPNTNNSGNYPLTGCDHDGTEGFSFGSSVALGTTDQRTGRPNSSTAGHGPLSGGPLVDVNTAPCTASRRSSRWAPPPPPTRR